MAADQLQLFSLPSPCIGVCESTPRGYCKGCLRSRDERFNWHQKSVAEQQDILRRLSQRRARLLKTGEADESSDPSSSQGNLF